MSKLSIRTETVHGRQAYTLENGKIRIDALRGSGHLLCFPAFGPPTPDEITHGFTFHGEAVAVEWRQSQPSQLSPAALTLSYGADLPQTQYRVERAVTFRANETVVQVEEWIENLAFFTRPDEIVITEQQTSRQFTLSSRGN